MQDQIVQYGVAFANDQFDLAGCVMQQISKGWQPYGSVFITAQFDQTFFNQPMVIYDLKKKNSRI